MRPPSWVIQSSTVGRPIRPSVVDGILETEFRAGDQQRAAAVVTGLRDPTSAADLFR